MKDKTEYSLPEVAAMIGVSHPTVYLWAKKGKIKTRKTGIMPGSPRRVSHDELTRIKRELGIA